MYYVLTFSLIWGFLYSFFLVTCSGSLLQFQFNFTFSEIFISNHFISRIRLSTYCRLTFLSFLLPYFFKFLPKVSQKSNFCLVAPKSVLELAAIQIAHTFLFAMPTQAAFYVCVHTSSWLVPHQCCGKIVRSWNCWKIFTFPCNMKSVARKFSTRISSINFFQFFSLQLTHLHALLVCIEAL